MFATGKAYRKLRSERNGGGVPREPGLVVTVPISWTGREFGASLLKESCEVMLVMDWAESGRTFKPEALLAIRSVVLPRVRDSKLNRES
jgi:hypothetical protein